MNYENFFIVSLFFLFGCNNIYTIQNKYKENVIAGSVILSPSQCVEFFDFPLIGDFPIKFRYKNNQLFSRKSYPPAHYVISEKAEIVKQDKACPIEIVGTKYADKKQEDETNATNNLKKEVENQTNKEEFSEMELDKRKKPSDEETLEPSVEIIDLY